MSHPLHHNLVMGVVGQVKGVWPLRRVSDEEVSLAQHVGHDTAVDDRLSWRAADLGAALERPATHKRYKYNDGVYDHFPIFKTFPIF